MRVLVLISLVASLTDVSSGSLLRGVTIEQDSEQDAGKIGVEKEYVTDLESRKVKALVSSDLLFEESHELNYQCLVQFFVLNFIL
jgi:hypothetical protein